MNNSLPARTQCEGKSTSEPTWSEHQHAIFDELTSGTSSLVIHAVAGSGKTTTLVELAKRIPKGKLAIALAFNKSMAETLQARLPYWVQGKTFHSHCYEALKASLPKAPRVDFKKVGNVFKAIAKNDKDFYKHVGTLTKLVGYAKSSGLGTRGSAPLGAILATDTHVWRESEDSVVWQQWSELVDYFDVDTDEPAELIRYAQLTLEASNMDVSKVDFDDMLYLTLLRNVPFQRADFLLVDEAQDLNEVQRELLGRMIKEGFAQTHQYEAISSTTFDSNCQTCNGKARDAIHSLPGRLIAVGDPHQAIYGFRGADAAGMEKITEAFGAKVLPLSTSYRCSQAVVVEANKVLNSN